MEFVKPGANLQSAMINAGFTASYAKSRAKNIMDRPMIQERLAELRATASQESGITREDNLQGLIDLAEDPLVNPAVKVKARETINKMMGWNEPEKVDVNHTFNLDTETQLRMAERMVIEHGGKVVWPEAKVIQA